MGSRMAQTAILDVLLRLLLLGAPIIADADGFVQHSFAVDGLIRFLLPGRTRAPLCSPRPPAATSVPGMRDVAGCIGGSIPILFVLVHQDAPHELC